MRPDNYRRRKINRPERILICQTCNKKFNPKKEKSRNPNLCRKCNKLKRKLERKRNGR